MKNKKPKDEGHFLVLNILLIKEKTNNKTAETELRCALDN